MSQLLVSRRIIQIAPSFSRSLSVSTHSLNASSSPSTLHNSTKETLDHYFNYYNTNAKLRPYIYRPKNHNKLLTMSIPIKDNHNNIIDHKLPMAQDPIIPISSTLISNYINDPNNKPTDLIDWFIKWTNVPTRKSAIWKLWKSNHLQDILLISLFQSSSSSSSGTTTNYNTFINLIYTLKVRFIKAKNKNVYDVNLFNTIMFGNLIRDIYFNQYKTSPDRATQIIKNSWNSINPHKSDQTGMTNLLLQVLTQRFKMDPFTSLNGVNILFPLNLPSYVSGDNKTRFLLQNKCNYIMARSLIDKLGEKHGISLDSDQINNLKKFITQYQRIIPGDSIDPFESLFKHIST